MKRFTQTLLPVLFGMTVGVPGFAAQTTADPHRLPPSTASFADGFEQDSRGQYKTGGTVDWDQGRLVLKHGGWLRRSLKADQKIRVTLDVDWLGDGKPGEPLTTELSVGLMLANRKTVWAHLRRNSRVSSPSDRSSDPVEAPSTVVRSWSARLTKTFWERQPKSAKPTYTRKRIRHFSDLVQFGEGPYTISLSHGLIRVENADDVLFRWHVDDAGSKVNGVILWAGQGDVAVRALDVAGLPRLKRLTQEQLEEAKRLNALSKEASDWYERDEYRKAAEVRQTVMDLRSKLVGENTTGFATDWFWLGACHSLDRGLGDPAELWKQALPVYERVYGNDHPQTAVILEQLGLVLVTGDKPDPRQAEPYYRRAATIRRDAQGKDNPSYRKDRRALADVLQTLASRAETQEDFETARRKREDILEIQTELHGRLHWRTVEARLALRQLGRRRSLTGEQRLRLRWAEQSEAQARRHAAEGQYSEAAKAFEKALELRKTLLGEKHRQFADTLNRLAVAYARMNRPARSEFLSQKALEISTELFGDHHPDVAQLNRNLGYYYRELKDYGRAIGHFRRAAASYRRLGEDHERDHRKTLDVLADVLGRAAAESARQMDFETARRQRDEILEIVTQLYGEEHWRTFDARWESAHVRRLAAWSDEERSRLGEAERLGDQSRQLQQDNKPKQAVAKAREAVEIAGEAGVPRIHRDRLFALGQLSLQQEDYTAAAAVYQRVAKLDESIFQPLDGMHPDHRLVLNQWAYAVEQTDNWPRAIPLYRRSLRISKPTEGLQARSTVVVIGNLCRVLNRVAGERLKDGEFAESKGLREEVLGLWTELHGRDDWRARNAGLALEYLEQYASLGAEQRQQLQVADRGFDEAETLLEKSQYAEAAQTCRQVLETRRELLGPDSWWCGAVLVRWGDALDAQGDIDGAQAHYEDAVEISRKVFPQPHPQLAHALERLGLLLASRRRYDAARPLLEQALAVREQAAGPKSASTSQTRRNLESLEQAAADANASRPGSFMGSRMSGQGVRLLERGQQLAQQGAFDRAIELQQQAVQISRRLYPTTGELHRRGPQVLAMTLRTLAVYQARGGDLSNARVSAQEALHLLVAAVGPDHWETVEAKVELQEIEALAALEPAERRRLDQAQTLEQNAGLLVQQGELRQAIDLAEKAISIRVQTVGEFNSRVAKLRTGVGHRRDEAGDKQAARTHFERALAIREKLFGQHHPKTADSLKALGLFYQRRGKFEPARDCLERALSIREQIHDPDSEETATALHNLAGVLIDLSEFGAAQAAAERAFQIRKQQFGLAHLDTANSLNSLGIILQARGRLPEARNALERVVAVWRNLSDAQMTLASGLKNLGSLVSEMGDKDAARGYLDESIGIIRMHQGPDSPELIPSLNTLAILLTDQREWDRAEATLRGAFRISQPLEKDDPRRRLVTENLADLLIQIADQEVAAGKTVTALERLDEALTLKRALFGPDHQQVTHLRVKRNDVMRLDELTEEQRGRLPDPDSIVTRVREVYDSDGRDAALKMATRALETTEQTLGPECRTAAYCHLGVAIVYTRAEQFDQAETHALQSLEIFKKLFGEQHPETTAGLEVLGVNYRKAGKLLKAKDVLRTSADIRIALLGERHELSRSALEELAAVNGDLSDESQQQADFAAAVRYKQNELDLSIRLWGNGHWRVEDAQRALADLQRLGQLEPASRQRLDDAEQLEARRDELSEENKLRDAVEAAEQVVEVFEGVFGAGHPRTAAALTSLGNLLERLGDLEAARPVFERALAIREDALGDEHPLTADSLDDLAGVLRQMQQFPQARRLQERALAMNKALYGTEHVQTTLSLNNLGLLLDEIGEADAAKSCYEQVIAIRQKLLGPDHVWLATPLMNLGALLAQRNDYATARKHLERAVNLNKRHYGLDNEHTALSLGHLAGLLHETGELQAARTLMEQELAIWQKLYDEHPRVVVALLNLGRLCRDLDDQAAALAHIERSLAVARRIYGREHRQVAICLDHLAAQMRVQGNSQMAEQHAREAVQICRQAMGPEHPETANMVGSLGFHYQQMAKDSLARKSYLEALEIDRKAWGPEHPKTAARLRQIANRFREMGDYTRSRRLCEQSLAIVRKTRDAEHADVADTLVALGRILYELGDFAAARRHLEESLAIERTIWGSAHRDTAVTCQYLALVVDAMGDSRGYVEYSDEALSIAENVWGPKHPQLIVYLNNLAIGVKDNEPDRARALRERALAILQQKLDQDDPPTAASLLAVADQLRTLQRHADTLPVYQQALSLQQKQYGEAHPEVAFVLRKLARAAQALERHAEAKQWYEQALAIFDASPKAGSPDVSGTRIELANVLLSLNERDEARTLYDRALAELRKTRGGQSPFVANFLYSGAVHFLQADDPQTALRYVKEAAQIRESALGPEHPETVQSRLGVGQCLTITGDYTAAWRELSAAARTFARQVSLNLVTHSEERHAGIVGSRRYVFNALMSLADAAPDVAERHASELLSILLDWKAMSGRSLMARQEALALEQDPDAVDLFEELKAVRQELVQSRLSGGGGDGSAHVDDLKARQAEIERRLAKTVRDYAVLRRGMEAGPDAIAARLPAHSAMIEFVKYQHYDFTAGGGGKFGEDRYAAILFQPLPRKTWLTDFAEAEAASKRLGKPLLVHFHAQWAGHSIAMDRDVLDTPEFQDLLDQFVAVRLDVGKFDRHVDLMKRFKVLAVPCDVFVSPDGRVLNQLRGNRKKDAFIRAIRDNFGLSPRGVAPRYVALGEAEEIDGAISRWRRSVDSGIADPAADALLQKHLWQPLTDALYAGTDRLFLAPDGQLALLPFEAIRRNDGTYLVEHYHFSYVSNGRDLMPRLSPSGEPGPAVVVSNPDYNALGAQQTSPGELLASASQTRSGDVATRSVRFDSLPGFAREAQAVASAWQRTRPGQQLLVIQDADANEESLMQIRRPRVLHLVTHGFFYPDLRRFSTGATPSLDVSPSAPPGRPNRGFAPARPQQETQPLRPREDPRLRSGLALAGANNWRRRSELGHSDGLLTAREVENLNLWGTELVVLSACQTGLGEVQVGEGVLGLRRAFQQAGARTVLSSLWKVPDTETEQLMSRFFELWLSGTPKSQALRTAQLELIARLRAGPTPRRQAAPPKYWAGFICHGRPD